MPLRLEMVTAERTVYSDDVDLLVAPGAAGELGVLPSHAPLLTSLRPGEIRVVKNGEESFIAISGGFLEVMANKATILADTAEHVEEIDIQRAEEAQRRARERIERADAEVDLERAIAALRRSEVRIAIARRHRRRAEDRPSRPSSQ